MKKNKKAALLLAVMGLSSLPAVMDNSLAGGALGSVNKAEAAFQYIPINEVAGGGVSQGVNNHAKGIAPEDGFLLIGSGDVDDIHVIVDGKEIAYNYADWSSTTVPIAKGSSYEIYDSDGTFNNGGIYFVKTPLSSSTIKGAVEEILKHDNSKANVSLNNITDAGKQVIHNTVAGDISAAENRSKTDAQNKANTAQSNAKTYTDEVAKGKANISMDNINEAGKQVIRDLAKDEIKNSGIDTTGGTIIINKPMETKDIHVDGGITTTGGITAGGNIHGKGDLEIDGKTHLHGDTEIDKNLTVHGDERIDGSLDVGGDSHIHGSQTVDGDSHVKGNETVDKDLIVHGNETVDGTLHVKNNAEFDKDVTVHGSETIDKNLHVKGNTETDGNSTVHGSQTVDKDLNVKGSTTLGDNATDKLTVNATSEFKADATFDKNLHVKGDAEVDGNLTTHGNHIIKGDTYMEGDSYVRGNVEVDENAHIKGNGLVDGDFEVKGNIKLGDDKKNDVLDVNAKTNLHGDTTIGDDENDKLVINATTDFASNATFGKNVHIKGSLETDGDSRTHGSSEVDGDSTTHGNYRVDKNLSVGGDADIEKNLHVGGDAVVDGDIYGRSFNVGNEKYIDKDGINANNHKIRNVADGDIGPDSLDAVNGRQLYHTREALQHNINQVGAGSAAMANLHPLEFEHSDKVSVSAAVGNYKDQTAFAAGVYVRPDTKSLISISGTMGYGENMIGAGFSKKFGKHTDFENMTDEQLKDALAKLSEDAKDIREQNKALREETKTLKAENGQLAEELAQNSAKDAALKDSNESLRSEVSELSQKNSLLESSLSEVKNAYNALITKVDSLMAKVGFSDTTEK